jgi:hypothetical protein
LNGGDGFASGEGQLRVVGNIPRLTQEIRKWRDNLTTLRRGANGISNRAADEAP